jgi:hypothetical protein
VKLYEHIIVGDGPVSRILQAEILSRGSEFLVLDSGIGLRQLTGGIEVDSNINYVAKKVAPSFHELGSNFYWAGGCQGWPSRDFGTENGQGLPQNPNSAEYKAAVKRVNNLLRVWNFNFYSNLPFFDFNLQSGFRNRNIEKFYCKVLKDPKLTRLHKKVLKSKSSSYNNNFVLNKIVPSNDFITVHGFDPETNAEMKFDCKTLSLCLGAIENTRVLLLSSKELGLDKNKNLGKNLSDHLAFKYATIHTSNLPRMIREFARPKTVDGGRLWPRLKSSDQGMDHLSNSFVHVDQFCFDEGIPLSFKVLRRLGKENFYFSRKRSGTFDLNIFSEKRNDVRNSLELIKGKSHDLSKLRIRFMIEESEAKELLVIGKYWGEVLKSEYEGEIGEFSMIPDVKALYSAIHAGSHPSGVHRMSITPEDGVINPSSELWTEPRVRIMGSGSYGRASCTHPTYTSMVLGVLGLKG